MLLDGERRREPSMLRVEAISFFPSRCIGWIIPPFERTNFRHIVSKKKNSNLHLLTIINKEEISADQKERKLNETHQGRRHLLYHSLSSSHFYQTNLAKLAFQSQANPEHPLSAAPHFSSQNLEKQRGCTQSLWL